MGIIRALRLTPEEVRTFREEGALKIDGLLTAEGVAAFREMVEADLAGSAASLGRDGDFHRLKYDVGNMHPVTRQLLGAPEFKRLMHALVPSRILFTQGIGFGLEPGKHGFDWHFEFISFAYIEPPCPAYSLWISFDDIDPTGQKGGMEYVPANVYSGRDKLVLSSRHVIEGPKVIEEVGGLEAYRREMPCAGTDRVVLDRARREPSFRPGDALLFNRWVWHKSCALEPGPLARRLAYVMRFVDADAKYAGSFLKKLSEFSVSYGNPNTKVDFGLKFSDLADGDPIASSRFAVDLV